MSPEVVSNIAKNYNPQICLQPIPISPAFVAVCLSHYQKWYQESWGSGNQPEDKILQFCEFLVKLIGDDDPETEDEPKGRVEQKEGLSPSLARI